MMRYNRGGGKFYRGDAMDEYLNKLGLVRKVNAKDESSLFRAVAEQVKAPIDRSISGWIV